MEQGNRDGQLADPEKGSVFFLLTGAVLDRLKEESRSRMTACPSILSFGITSSSPTIAESTKRGEGTWSICDVCFILHELSAHM